MRIRVLIFCVVFFAWLPGLVLGQATISGKVFNKDAPLDAVSVTLLKAGDSNYVAGVVTDKQGKFSIKNITMGNYLLVFSATGYQKKIMNHSVEGSADMILPLILMEEQFVKMQEITVNSKRIPVKLEAGKTVVNVSDVTLGGDGSVLSLLSKIPGVLILSDGTVLLNGQSGATVMIDDKLTFLSGENLVNLLRSIPASTIDKVEMVSQPAARYDANTVSGLINIQRKKKSTQGLTATVSSNAEAGNLVRSNHSASLHLQQRKLQLYANYAFNAGKDFMRVHLNRRFLDNTDIDATGLRLDMNAKRNFTSGSHYFKTGMQYNISPKLDVGISVQSNWFHRKKEELAISEFFYQPIHSDSTLHTRNSHTMKYHNLFGSFDLVYKFNKKMKWENTFTVLNFNQDDDFDQQAFLKIPGSISKFDTLVGTTDGRTAIYTGQSDLLYDIKDNISLSAGLKYSSININSDAVYKTRENGDWQESAKLSSGFIYKEQVRAAYVQVNKKWSPRWSAEAGLRLEHTTINTVYTLSKQNSTYMRSYMEWFPSFLVKYAVNKDHALSLQFNRRIVRPNYRDLNPFVEVNDRFLQERGNAALNPELVQQIEASWLIQSQYSVTVFYRNRQNPIAKIYATDTVDKSATVMPLNLSRNDAVGIRASINNLHPFAWWTIHITPSLAYRKFRWQEEGIIKSSRLYTPTLQVNNQFSLPHKWAIDVTGYYNGKAAEFQAMMGAMGAVAAGVRKSLLNNRMSIYLYVNDIFLTNKARINVYSSFVEAKYKDRRDSRMIGISLQYRFHSGSTINPFRKQDGNDESKRINL